MPAAGARRMLQWVPIVLFSLLASVRAQPCARLYMRGLDSTTTVYPQLAGVYKLQTSVLYHWMRGYPIYQHELDALFLYYNSSQQALVMGPLQSQGLLKVQRTSGTEVTSDVDYSLSHLFAFSAWKQWDPRQRRFLENRNLSHMQPQCVDEMFGFCSSGRLHPTSLYARAPILIYRPGATVSEFEFVSLSEVYFTLLDGGVSHNLRPVYKMVNEGRNRTTQSRKVQRYLYHKNGKWRVGAEIGSTDRRSGIFLELEGNAMRVEYENETVWQSVDINSHRRAFGGLQCSRQLPGSMNCQVEDVVTCHNAGTCHTDTNNVSSCLCPAGYRGIQCKRRISECDASFQTPPQASSVFVGPTPHYEGTIMTVFCLSGEVEYSVCENGIWLSATECPVPTTTTTTSLVATPLASTTTWSYIYNQSGATDDSKDSVGTVASVIVVLVCIQLGCPFLCYCCAACCQSDNEHLDEEIPADDELKLDVQKRKASLQRTCSGFFYVCWWAWLLFAVIYLVRYGDDPLDGSTILSAVAIMAFVCLGVLYCGVVFESMCSNEYKYLTQLENEEVTAGEQITEMKAAKPTITFRAECSRNETRTRTVYGNRGPREETYTQRVKGAVVEEQFVYTDCYDDSVNFVPPHARVTKVHVELVIEFADDASKHVYEEAYEAFKARHLTRDQFVEFSSKNDLPGFVKRLAVHDPNYDVPTWMSSSCFCLASCCCLSWPYRWVFNSSVSSYSYRIVKKVLARPGPVVNQPQSSGDFQPPPVAATFEPYAPPLPVIYTDDNTSVPIIPSDQIPSAPPPSYEEFTANPTLFGSAKHSVHESIPMSDVTL